MYTKQAAIYIILFVLACQRRLTIHLCACHLIARLATAFPSYGHMR